MLEVQVEADGTGVFVTSAGRREASAGNKTDSCEEKKRVRVGLKMRYRFGGLGGGEGGSRAKETTNRRGDGQSAR